MPEFVAVAEIPAVWMSFAVDPLPAVVFETELDDDEPTAAIEIEFDSPPLIKAALRAPVTPTAAELPDVRSTAPTSTEPFNVPLILVADMELEDEAPTPATEIELPVPPRIFGELTVAPDTVTLPAFMDSPVTVATVTALDIVPPSVTFPTELDDDAPTAASEMLFEMAPELAAAPVLPMLALSIAPVNVTVP